MATVYLARDIKLNRPVAIKVLRPELSDLLGRERFLREVEIAAGLQHPHIVPLYDSGSADGLLYYVMRLVEGESLRDRLDREKQLPLEDALQVAREVAEALSYAHSLGIVHRDIKPANILLSGGHALVADFGVARAITAAGGEQLTERGIAVGTPAYMSPEQGSGQDPIDGRSDVYALGCVLYEMLAGDPPFSGRTVQAIFARHQQERPPSLRVVRPTVSLGVQRVIETALAKVPADRYSTGTQFVAALEAAQGGRLEWRRRLAWTAGIVACAVLAIGLWRYLIAPGTTLDGNRVVVFPLSETPPGSGREGMGEAVAYMIGSGLEHTDPLKWIDGWAELDPQQRANLALLTARSERHIARDRGARWYLDGSVVRRGDTATVVLRLNDVRGDSVVDRASASRLAPEAAEAGLQAVNELLPRLLAPGRRVDLTALAERRPAAVASWLQGEREYRRSNFAAALDYLRRAVAEDSALAVAAVRGAQAASWVNRLPEAGGLAQIALDHIELLPPRQALFARGLAAYLSGRADSAVLWLTRALSDAPEWTEAHMLLGEVYYHLLPLATGSLDSLAEAEFNAATADTGFGPPRFHLAEIAIRKGNLAQAQRAVKQFEQFGGDIGERRQIALMLDCASKGRSALDWRRVVADAPSQVNSTGKALAVAGAFPACAEDAFRAILASPTAEAYHWGAFLELQGILAAEGRTTELETLIDSMVTGGLRPADRLYILDAFGGVAVDAKSEETARRYEAELGPKFENGSPQGRWLLGCLRARDGDLAEAEVIRAGLEAEAVRTHDPGIAKLAKALSARLYLQRHDTASATALLREILPDGRREALEWDLGEPLAGERLLYAQVLLARGAPAEALAVAGDFDHPSPAIFLPYLPASLALRRRAALALGLPKLAERFADRLARLGQGLVADVPANPSTVRRRS